MTYVELQKQGMLEKRQSRRRDKIAEGWLPSGVERVRDWDEVIKWVEALEQRGGM
jgi:hypothetical protein